MIKLNSKVECCGCSACYNICPKKAISMKEDSEGFLYPVIDKNLCVNCGLCDKVCPIINSRNEFKEQKAYVVNNINEKVRSESSSGGAFTAIAEYIIESDGIVFGAGFNSKFEVLHFYVDKKEQLYKQRGSKYVQSFLGDCFTQVKKILDEGKLVCFSGTPCQIEGLKKYLNKEYENLVTIDVMCHSVPSPLVLRKYLKYIRENKLSKENIKKVSFRDKSKYGYKYSTMTVVSKNKRYSKGVESDPYLRAFFNDLSVRPSCYDCRFKKQYHVSDFTIWDCFIAENFEKSLDDDKGTSRILVNTEKGNKIFESIKTKFKYKEVEVDELTKNVKEMLNSVKMNENRGKFFEDINNMNEKDFFEKWFPDSLNVKVERGIRVFLAKTGVYKNVKNTIKKILRR